MEHKKPPFLAREEPLYPSWLLHRATMEAAADRAGRWSSEGAPDSQWASCPLKGKGTRLAEGGSGGGHGQTWAASASSSSKALAAWTTQKSSCHQCPGDEWLGHRAPGAAKLREPPPRGLSFSIRAMGARCPPQAHPERGQDSRLAARWGGARGGAGLGAPTARRRRRRRRVRAPDRAATQRRRPSHPETQAMRGSLELLVTWFLVLVTGGTKHVYRPSRRVCAVGAARGPVLESFVQRVYQPFLTTCDGHRACSTYRTIYRTAYRHSPGPVPTRPRYACCPGWKRTNGLPGACETAICQPPCGNGGSCVWPGRCHCPAGWRGDTCHTDVDECSTGEASCPQHCVNTVGSYWCQCWEGHSLSEDGMLCLPKEDSSRVAPTPTTGMDSTVREEVHRLQSRVDVLEQKLQLVLAPLHSLASRALEPGLRDPGRLLAHSFQQLDRIDSLSEQVSFLEEQLGSCSCKKEL